MKKALYSAHVTGTSGTNIVLLYIGDDGHVGGIDGGRGKYRGTAEALPNGGLRASLTLAVAPGTMLITGAPSQGVSTIPIQFELPAGFDRSATTIAISTPVGEVKARFEKVMDLR